MQAFTILGNAAALPQTRSRHVQSERHEKVKARGSYGPRPKCQQCKGQSHVQVKFFNYIWILTLMMYLLEFVYTHLHH